MNTQFALEVVIRAEHEKNILQANFRVKSVMMTHTHENVWNAKAHL